MEKLSETLGIRVTTELLYVIKQVAEMHGMSPGEWVRCLIDQALQSERAKFEALKLIFDQEDVQANNNRASHG